MHLYALVHVKFIYLYSFDILSILYVLQSGYLLVIDSFVELESQFGSTKLEPIDLTTIDISASDLGHYSPPQTYFGERMPTPVAINLSYCLGCSPNYNMCTVNAVPQCVLEHECINGKS